MTLCLSLATVVPSILSQVPNEAVSVDQGSTGILSCVARGLPLPTISWFLNGVEISSYPYFNATTIIYNSSYVNSSLEFGPADSSFAGNFSCQAVNNYGSDITTFQVEINTGIQFLVICRA